MPAMRLGGLASGLDTEALVSQLLAVERNPRIRLEQKVDVVEARKGTLNDIGAKLRALRTAVADLRSATLFGDTQTVETSDATRVGVTRTGSVGTGAYMVKVTAVAAGEQRTFAYAAPASDSELTVDGKSTTIRSGATLAEAITAINADSEAKVWASDVGGRLALTWRATGSATNDDVVTGAMLDDEQLLRAGRNADVTIDGKQYTPSTNELKDLPGLSLTIKAPTSADVAITVGPPGPDKAKVVEKVKAFVDAYNAANDLMRAELREERVVNPASKADRGKGVLRGDPTISGLQAQLRIALTTSFATGSDALNELADLGVSTGKAAGSTTFSRDAVEGKLTLDTAKLESLLTSDPARVKQVLGATGNGIAQKLEEVLKGALDTGGTFASRVQGADAEVKRLKDQMTAFDGRLEQRERALRATYTRLELALNRSQSQGDQLASRLAAL